MPRTDARRAAYLVWGGWLLVTGLTFSLMAGIFHAYYTIALAPAIGALVGMGGREAWERRHTSLGLDRPGGGDGRGGGLVVHPALAHSGLVPVAAVSACSSSAWQRRS